MDVQRALVEIRQQSQEKGRLALRSYQVRKSVMQKEDEDEKGKTKDEAKSRKERGLYKH